MSSYGEKMPRNGPGQWFWGGWQPAALLLVLLVALPPSNAAAGGGWVKKKRGFYGKVSVGSLRSNRYYSLTGTLNDQGAQFRQTSVNLYAEYGLTNRLTAILNVPAWRSNRFATTGRTTGIGDAMVELKYGLLTGKIPVAVSVAPSLPIGKSRALVADVNTPGSLINLPIGDGELNVWTRLYASLPISSRAYVSFDGGLNLRTQGFSNQYTAGAEVGYKVGRVWVNGTIRQLATIGTPNPNKGSFVYGEGLAYLGYSVGAAVPITSTISLTVDYANLLSGQRNVYAGATLGVGLSVQID